MKKPCKNTSGWFYMTLFSTIIDPLSNLAGRAAGPRRKNPAKTQPYATGEQKSEAFLNSLNLLITGLNLKKGFCYYNFLLF